jgi:hypothetical protein
VGGVSRLPDRHGRARARPHRADFPLVSPQGLRPFRPAVRKEGLDEFPGRCRGGFFGGQHEKHAGENIINTFDHAGQNAVAGYGAARDASLGYFQPYLQGGTNAFSQAGR